MSDDDLDDIWEDWALDYEDMWTTQKDDYALIRRENEAYVIYHLPTKRIKHLVSIREINWDLKKQVKLTEIGID